MCTVRPETWQKWHGPQAGSTMFLSPGEQVSVENLLHGIVTLSGNDATVVLAECIAGTEEAFASSMNDNAQAARPDQQPFRQFATAGPTKASPMSPRTTSRRSPAPTIENHPDLYKQVLQPDRASPGARRSGRAPTSRRPTAIRCSAASPAPTASRPAIPTRRAMALPARRSRTAVACHGRRRARQLQPADRGIGASDGMGLQRLAVQALVQVRAQISARRRCSLAATARSSLVAPRDLAVTIPAGVLSKTGAMKIRYNGPVKAPIAKGQHIADLVVSTPDTARR